MHALLLIALAQVPFGLNTPDGGPAPAIEQPPIDLPPEGEPDAGAVEPVPIEAPDAGEPQPPEPEVEPAPAFTHKNEVNGYVSSRTAFGRSRVYGLIPTGDAPQWSTLLELNMQLKVSYHHAGFVYADVSGVGQFGWDYRSVDKNDVEQFETSKDVATVRPLISINEIYLLQELTPWLNLMFGKKRLVWGAGQAFNPTDLINVRKDPTDPTFQRAGAWVARLEVPLEQFAFTVLFSPMVTESAFGIPYAFITYPDWDKKDDQSHYLIAARAYALIGDTDVNLMFFYSNKYLDDFEKKPRLGASLSRVFFETYETHVEFLLQSGSGRQVLDPACVVGSLAALGCVMGGTLFQSRVDDPTLQSQLLVGLTKTFPDDSILSVEYLYQADGLTRSQYQDLVNALDLADQARQFGQNVPIGAFLGGGGNTGLPSRFTFVPTVQHYAFLTYRKAQIRDDFTFALTTIVNLQDLSTLWTPSIIWSATEWLELSLRGFIPVPGPDVLAATAPSTGDHVSEYGLTPVWARAFFEARIFY